VVARRRGIVGDEGRPALGVCRSRARGEREQQNAKISAHAEVKKTALDRAKDHSQGSISLLWRGESNLARGLAGGDFLYHRGVTRAKPE
jgi:hypothetical protein